MLTLGFIHDDNIINTETVPQYLCYECRKLNTATIGDTAVKIGNWAFSSCFTLNELYFGKNLKNILTNAPKLSLLTVMLSEISISATVNLQ